MFCWRPDCQCRRRFKFVRWLTLEPVRPASEAGALQSLSLAPSGAISMTTPSTGPNPVTCDQYDVGVFVVHPVITLGLDTMPIIECQSLGGGIQALLGRDFLGLCLFVYDGQAQRFYFGI